MSVHVREVRTLHHANVTARMANARHLHRACITYNTRGIYAEFRVWCVLSLFTMVTASSAEIYKWQFVAEAVKITQSSSTRFYMVFQKMSP
jgi:hypothetical protein